MEEEGKGSGLYFLWRSFNPEFNGALGDTALLKCPTDGTAGDSVGQMPSWCHLGGRRKGKSCYLLTSPGEQPMEPTVCSFCTGRSVIPSVCLWLMRKCPWTPNLWSHLQCAHPWTCSNLGSEAPFELHPPFLTLRPDSCWI